MNKFLKGFLIGAILAGISTASFTHAQIGSINFFKKVGNTISLINDAWTLSANNAEFGNVSIGGASVGDIDMQGNDILNIGYLTSSSTKGSGDVTPKGSNILIDGGLELWDDANTLTNWNKIIFANNPVLDRESSIVHSGTYSAKTTNDGGIPMVIEQKHTSLTVGATYNIIYWAKLNTTGDGRIILLNDSFSGSATQIYKWSTGSWENYTGAEFTNPNYQNVQSLDGTYTQYTTDNFIVPANGVVNMLIYGQDDSGGGTGNEIFYFDDIDLSTPATTTPSEAINMWDLKNPSDSSLLTSSDNIFKIGTTGGTPETMVQWTGTGSYAFTSRDGSQISMALVNKTRTNTNDNRGSSVDFIGFKTDGTESPAGAIRVSHDGTGDDFASMMSFRVNSGALSDPFTAMIIKANGSVGIGTSTFNYGEKLAVGGAMSAEDYVAYTNGSGDSAGINFFEDNDNRALIDYKQGEHYLKFGTVNASVEYETMFLLDGKVGIGTSTPNAKFEIVDSSTSTSHFTINGLDNNRGEITLGDDETLLLPNSTYGWGHVMAGDNEEFARFSWTSSGVVTLDEASTNVTSTDTDANLCIFDNGAGVTVRNRLGSSKTIKFIINY